jgi:hypothetical protein
MVVMMWEMVETKCNIVGTGWELARTKSKVVGTKCDLVWTEWEFVPGMFHVAGRI